jgi:hypothetical protein
MATSSVWVDEFFSGCDVETIGDTIATHTMSYYGTITIHGFTYGPNIDKIIESFGTTNLKNYRLIDVKAAKQQLINSRRIFALEKVSGLASMLPHRAEGYCVVATKKILAAEVGIEVQDSSNLLREIASLKGELSQQKSKILELESEIQVSNSTLRDKEAVLAGRANLSWS